MWIVCRFSPCCKIICDITEVEFLRLTAPQKEILLATQTNTTEMPKDI